MAPRSYVGCTNVFLIFPILLRGHDESRFEVSDTSYGSVTTCAPSSTPFCKIVSKSQSIQSFWKYSLFANGSTLFVLGYNFWRGQYLTNCKGSAPM